MSTAIEKKKQVVAEIADKLTQSKATILTDYRGLSVSQMTELRKQLREAGVEYQVLKNTMTRRATAQTNLTELDDKLVGPTAIAFSNDDVVAPAKVLHKFSKENKELEIKGGVVEGRVVSLDQIKELAELPSREGLLSMLLSVLQAPMRNFALAVKAVADKDGEGESAEA
ncbi:50S ribosomal protein L10 [Kroppenstedtia eburnea]|uniref:Large ribosomal subunit protein uL10 n=1 Tax=Kroppenstedtia eburnea TaxID=714067 RepID=A0A1N7MZ67_9BACL|nr:50S ribosomal protein L10 [Kroppenstedtia eburnea]EGK09717.1 50S ribosomal protein L10 [Desmospora sp. 8437]QKI80745.1 50S ribosomal protein L10 [Kroppenstedtia eburnea]SIS91413.1 LSU ribosomal protein L10P [Kroppenstedtia eburnea]